MSKCKANVSRVSFNALKLENYRRATKLKQKDMANIAGIPYGCYCDWIRNSYAPTKRIKVLRHIEEACNIDLAIETMPMMLRHEAKKYAKNRYKHDTVMQEIEVTEEEEEPKGLLLYPADCRRCPWRRGAMCLTPLCMKRRHEDDPGMVWGGHLEIVRGTNKN